MNALFNRSARTILSTGRGQRLAPKRWSAHNTLEPHPSNFDWMKWKDTTHFWLLVGGTPLAIITTIANIRANPELAEIREGYEPRHWEYFKSPIARFIARYLLRPDDYDLEAHMSMMHDESESIILLKLQKKIESTMRFYNDYRAMSFYPIHADQLRFARVKTDWQMDQIMSMNNDIFSEASKNEVTPVVGLTASDDPDRFPKMG